MFPALVKKQPRVGLSVISPIVGDTGHLTDEMESIQYQDSRFCDWILRGPVLKPVTETAPPLSSKFASNLLEAKSDFWGQTSLEYLSSRTYLVYLTKWHIQVGSIDWTHLSLRYALPSLFLFWLVDREEVIVKILLDDQTPWRGFFETWGYGHMG